MHLGFYLQITALGALPQAMFNVRSVYSGAFAQSWQVLLLVYITHVSLFTYQFYNAPKFQSTKGPYR